MFYLLFCGTLIHEILALTMSLTNTSAVGAVLSKIWEGQPKYWEGQVVAITDEIIGVSQLLEARAQAAP